jgi:steroid delta-isomerase-like uncharacterized protein
MRRFITLATLALIGAAVVTQWQRVRELGRQVLRKGTEEASGSAEENKAVARRGWEEVVNQRNLDAIEEIYAPDFVWHEPDQDIQGYEQAKQFASTFFEAFPDINISVEDVIAEGDQAVTRYTIRGTHRGETEEFGLPTGKPMELKGITIHRFEGDKIVEEWERYDNLSVLQQLGLVPEQ